MQQLKITIKIVIHACLLFGLALAQDASTTILNRVAGAEHVKADQVPLQERPQVISSIKTFLKEKHDYAVRLEAMDLLVRLKDDETIRDLVNKYHSNPLKDEGFLSRAANSEIIQFVAPDLYLPKDAGRQIIGDIEVPATRDWAADLILRCIANSPEFPTKTQTWVRSLDGRSNWSMTSQWWTHNKEAVLAKNYANAIWIPPHN